jgi:colicin import membrane protein
MTTTAQPVLPFDGDKPMGHNSAGAPDATRADFTERVAAFLKGADVWATRDTLDADLAARATDFVGGAKKLRKQADEARKVEKQPHADKVKEVDGWWGALDTKIEKLLKSTADKLTAYARIEQERKQREAEEARRKVEAAEQARKDAELAAAAATTESARIEAEAQADVAARNVKEASREEKRAAAPVKVASATGLARTGSMRKVWAVKIDDLTRAMLHLKKTNEPAFVEFVTQLAGAELRAAPVTDGEKQIPVIPGVTFSFTEKFV